jgi:hypothetical protein
VDGKWYRDAFPGNIVPQNRWSKVAKTVIGMKPLREPNRLGSWGNGGPSQNVMLGPMKVVKWDNYTTRIDQQFGPNLKAYGTWTYNQRWERNPPYTIANSFFDFTQNKSITPRQHTASVGTTWIVTPTLVNDFRATYYGQWRMTDSIAYNKDYASAIGLGYMGLASTCMPSVTQGFGSEVRRVRRQQRNDRLDRRIVGAEAAQSDPRLADRPGDRQSEQETAAGRGEELQYRVAPAESAGHRGRNGELECDQARGIVD